MIICNNCRAENESNAVFCKQCGKRLDGKVICSACGKLNPGDAAFCQNCGACLTDVVSDNTDCADGTKQILMKSVPAEKRDAEHAGLYSSFSEKRDFAKDIKKIFCVTSGYCLFAGVVFALVFVFLMGFQVRASVGDLTTELGSLGFSQGEYDILYFSEIHSAM